MPATCVARCAELMRYSSNSRGQPRRKAHADGRSAQRGLANGLLHLMSDESSLAIRSELVIGGHDGAMTPDAHHAEPLQRILLRRESLAAVNPRLATGSDGAAV